MDFSGSSQINNPLMRNIRITARRPSKVILNVWIATPRRVIEMTVRRRVVVHHCVPWGSWPALLPGADGLAPLLSTATERDKAKKRNCGKAVQNPTCGRFTYRRFPCVTVH
jgi:hypothetical protein